LPTELGIERPPFEVHEVTGKIICNAFATERKKKVTKSSDCTLIKVTQHYKCYETDMQ
jgi:hypothetical protein